MSEFRVLRSIPAAGVRRAGLAGALLAAAVLLAACGGSSSGSSSAASSGSSSGTSSGASSGAPAAGAAVRIQTASGDLGTYLTDGSGRTLYLFAADTGSTSTCSGPCAANWPPLISPTTPTVSGAAKASLVGSSKRTDGSMQVTYAGHPLYTYVGDTSKGAVKGQGLDVDGGLWWVVAPDGSRIVNTP